MEPTKGPIKYIINTKVANVFKRIETISVTKNSSGEFVHNKIDLGWHLSIEGSFISIYLGEEQPDLLVGDKIKISIEKIND